VTTVALIGPDGSGKTTIAARLRTELGVPAAYVYMGVNPDASDRQLITTRLAWSLKRRAGRRPDAGPPRAPAERGEVGGWKGARRQLRSLARVANLMADESYRSLLVRREERRGRVVLFDRHYFLDYHAHDIAGGGSRDLARRLHGAFLRHVLRKPDLVVYLEAPAAVLLQRKGEGTIADLERRQRDYELALAELPAVVRVAADRPIDDVVADVRTAVLGMTS
jgi:thymidylate kinase